MGYTLDEAMDLDDITPAEARAEIERHNASWEQFVAAYGEKPHYTGEEVLEWLGY